MSDVSKTTVYVQKNIFLCYNFVHDWSSPMKHSHFFLKCLFRFIETYMCKPGISLSQQFVWKIFQYLSFCVRMAEIWYVKMSFQLERGNCKAGLVALLAQLHFIQMIRHSNEDTSSCQNTFETSSWHHHFHYCSMHPCCHKKSIIYRC